MFGYIVLFGWPLVIIILFKTTSKPVAILCSLLTGYLLLPERLAYDLPFLPALNKNTLPSLTVFAVLLMQDHTRDTSVLSRWLPPNIFARLCIIALVIGTFFMVYTNGDTIVFGRTVLQALSYYDAVSLILSMMIMLLPLMLARKFLAHPEQQRTLLSAFAIAGALYAFLALYEVRMSPQLNNIVYGFFPHSFLQHIRGNGFRPLVFLNHGIWLAIFFSMCCLAALGSFRMARTGEERAKYLILGLWILMTLSLSRSLGALVITLILLPVLFLGRRLHFMAAAILAIIVMLYPLVRGAGLLPLDQILDWANSINPTRALSLQFRLLNEEVLLERAMERPVFGWGYWGRSFIYDDFGNNLSVTDGYWVIIIGVGGWIKYLGEFGLLCLPIIFLLLKRKAYDLGLETSILTLILAGNLVDLIPNATITPLTWLIAGSLWGRLELGRIHGQEEGTDLAPAKRRVRHSRFEGKTVPQPRSIS
jgi:hypothetical protein